MMAPCPESEFIHYRRHGENIHLKYYVTDSIRYLLLRFLEHHIGESNGLEAQDATRKLLDVVLVFDTENNMKTFSNYIATHLNDFNIVVSNQREAYIRDEEELAKKELAKEIRNSWALKKMQREWDGK